MEQVTNVVVNSEVGTETESSNLSSYEINLAEMEEMEPIESPAFIWGKWNFAGS